MLADGSAQPERIDKALYGQKKTAFPNPSKYIYLDPLSTARAKNPPFHMG